MGIFEDLLASAKNAVDVAGQKTDNVVEITKLKYQCVQLTNELKSLYEKLGSAVYSMKKAAYQNNDLMDSLIEEIDEIKERIKEVNDQIALRKEIILCPACGYQNDKHAIYCMKCGNKLIVDAQPEAASADDCCCTSDESADEKTEE